MTTPTTNLALTLYNSTTDQSESFANFRAVQSGLSPTSNMYKIDTAYGVQAAQITALQSARGSILVPAEYISANYYEANGITEITSLITNMTIILKLDTASDGTVTLNINSLGIKSVSKINSAGNVVNITGGELMLNKNYLFRYDGTEWIWVSANSGDQIFVAGTVGSILTSGTDNTILGTLTTVAANDFIVGNATNWIKKTLAETITILRTSLDSIFAGLAGLSTQTFSVAAATAIAHTVRADQIQTQSVTAYTTGGTTTAFTLTTLGTPIALTTNERWNVIFNATAGATPTLNRDGKGAKALKYYDRAGAKQSCGATIIIANMISDVMYDGTDYVVMSPAGTTSYVHPNHSGDVTSVADGAQTIGAGKVTLAMQANMATASLVYRKTAGAGAPEVNTLATLKTDLGTMPPPFASAAEINTGTEAAKAIAPNQYVASNRNIRYIVMSVFGPTTDWTADGTTNVGLEFSSPIAGTMVSIAANVQTAGTTGTAIVDVNLNASTIMSTHKLKWDSTEKSTRDYSGTAAALSTTALAVGDILTVDIDTNHTTKSKGLTVIIGVRLT